MSVMLAPDVDRFGAAAPPTLNTRFRASVPNHATRTTLAIPRRVEATQLRARLNLFKGGQDNTPN